ncbi:MAG: H-type lectin domain-containing protein [Magnetococcales bacterium]|nr:H-type lectin domain-containing protein [Magnetococcales bacterium]
MVRLIIWLLLLLGLGYAALLVRDGQTTLFGAPSAQLQAWLQNLPLPASKPPPPPPTEPVVPPHLLLRRLVMVEQNQGVQDASLRVLREQEMSAIQLSLTALKEQLARLENNQWAMENGEVRVRWDDKGWYMEDFFAKRRVLNQRIPFNTSFQQPPRIFLGMTRTENGPEGSVEVLSKDPDTSGFTLSLQAEEGKPREVKIQWLAFGFGPVLR